MARKKKKSDAVVLPSEEEIKLRPAPGFGRRMNKVMELVVGREISERLTNPNGTDYSILRKMVRK